MRDYGGEQLGPDPRAIVRSRLSPSTPVIALPATRSPWPKPDAVAASPLAASPSNRRRVPLRPQPASARTSEQGRQSRVCRPGPARCQEWSQTVRCSSSELTAPPRRDNPVCGKSETHPAMAGRRAARLPSPAGRLCHTIDAGCSREQSLHAPSRRAADWCRRVRTRPHSSYRCRLRMWPTTTVVPATPRHVRRWSCFRR